MPDDVADRLNAELSNAPPVCTCPICSSPRFVFCATGWRVLFARIQWVMNELDKEQAGGDEDADGSTR